MSVDAEIAVLFTVPHTAVASPPIKGCSILGLSIVEDADLHCWVSPTGQLEYRHEARSSALLGEPSLEGRIWIGTLGRHWTAERPQYGGDPLIYAAVVRELLGMPDVAYVWYGVLTGDGGCTEVQPATDEWITAFFGEARSAQRLRTTRLAGN